jgi:hypothetical protein
MPSPMIKKYAEESKTSIEQVEKLWSEAKAQATDKFKAQDGHYWAYVNSIVRKQLKLDESKKITFKEYVELEFEPTSDQPTQSSQETIVEPSTPPCEDSESQCSMALFIKTLFKARDIAHIIHLGTNSYAAHVAMNDLYNQLVEHADRFAETYQGQYGLIDFDDVHCTESFSESTKSFIESLVNWVLGKGRQCIPQDYHFLNLHDELTAMVLGIKYKLENLS